MPYLSLYLKCFLHSLPDKLFMPFLLCIPLYGTYLLLQWGCYRLAWKASMMIFHNVFIRTALFHRSIVQINICSTRMLHRMRKERENQYRQRKIMYFTLIQKEQSSFQNYMAFAMLCSIQLSQLCCVSESWMWLVPNNVELLFSFIHWDSQVQFQMLIKLWCTTNDKLYNWKEV